MYEGLEKQIDNLFGRKVTQEDTNAILREIKNLQKTIQNKTLPFVKITLGGKNFAIVNPSQVTCILPFTCGDKEYRRICFASGGSNPECVHSISTDLTFEELETLFKADSLEKIADRKIAELKYENFRLQQQALFCAALAQLTDE